MGKKRPPKLPPGFPEPPFNPKCTPPSFPEPPFERIAKAARLVADALATQDQEWPHPRCFLVLYLADRGCAKADSSWAIHYMVEAGLLAVVPQLWAILPDLSSTGRGHPSILPKMDLLHGHGPRQIYTQEGDRTWVQQTEAFAPWFKDGCPEEWLQLQKPPKGAKGANSANNPLLFPMGPIDRQDIRELVIQLDERRGDYEYPIEIAREITDEKKGNSPQADSMMTIARRLRKQGRIVY